MAFSSNAQTADRAPQTLGDDGERALRQDRYRAVARAVVELAWHDASGRAGPSRQVVDDARSFLFSEDAEFWTEAAGVDVRALRRRLRGRLARSEAPPRAESAPATTAADA